MNNYTTLVNARNRALAADPTPEQQALVTIFDGAMSQYYDSDSTNFVRAALVVAATYVSQPPTGEG